MWSLNVWYFQLTLFVLVSQVWCSPVFVDLKSEYPANPIEDPQSWAWGQHPNKGLGYKAKDNLEVEVCLANPSYINTAKCNLPLEVCLDNPQYLSSLGCRAHLTASFCAQNKELTLSSACSEVLQSYQPTLFECQDNKAALCSLNLCEKHQFIVQC